ncbi:hypothetical protein G7046_g9248 [Stylonectria norvegica]|nr:hypothetical protein G7046_g9248 [Stylonectria norvegica]
MSTKFLLTALLGASAVLARTDLEGCTSSDSVVSPSGGTAYATRIYYVPGTGEICEILDCGGGRAPPKTTVPGCDGYVGTATYSPSFLDQAASTAAASDAVSSASESASASVTSAGTTDASVTTGDETSTGSGSGSVSTTVTESASATGSSTEASTETGTGTESASETVTESASGSATGHAKMTRGYRLPARHVIHTVGPVYGARRHGREQALAAELLRREPAVCCARGAADCGFQRYQHGRLRVSEPAGGTGGVCGREGVSRGRRGGDVAEGRVCDVPG